MIDVLTAASFRSSRVPRHLGAVLASLCALELSDFASARAERWEPLRWLNTQ
jgi:hypothetical protein